MAETTLTTTQNVVIDPFTNVVLSPVPEAGDVRYGSQYFRDVNELQVGNGSKVMRVDASGLWLGAARFADAPFRVDMNGNVTATSLTTSLDMDDIANGATYAKTTFSQVLGAGYAYTGLNSSGEIVKGFINTQLAGKTLPANGVRVDNNGIYGTKASTVTFYIDTNGNAYFAGDIYGSSITGSTLSTALSGQRTVLSSSVMSFYDSSNTISASLYASGGSLLIKGQQSTSNIYLEAGTTGVIAFDFNSTVRFMASYDAKYFTATENSTIDLGTAAYRWKDLYLGGKQYYGAIVQPKIHYGVVSGGAIYGGSQNAFTVSNLSTGRYQVSHSIGHSNYFICITPYASTVKWVTIESFSSSNFVVRLANSSASLENNDFFFQVCEYPQ